MHSGGYCRKPTATGTASISALLAGATGASGSSYINSVSMLQTWKVCSWTAPAFVPTVAPLAQRRKKGQSAQALGRSRGGFSTKIHLLVDALGYPLNFILTPGNVADITQAHALLAQHRCQYVIADRGYDADKLVERIRELGAEPVIPPRANRTVQRIYDKHIYHERHLVECFINKLKYYRRICTRFDKLAIRFRWFLCFAASLIWLR